MILSETQKNTNYIVYLNKLKNYGVPTETLEKLYGDRIKNASFSMNDDDGYCFDGSLVYVTLNIMGKMAYNINTSVCGEGTIMHVPLNSLMKTVLLSNIGKAVMFTPQKDEWMRKKGKLYTFNEERDATMKLGATTLYMCQQCGITLDETEYEAITSIDYEDKVSRYNSPLCVILNTTRNMTSAWLRQSWLAEKKTETIEK